MISKRMTPSARSEMFSTCLLNPLKVFTCNNKTPKNKNKNKKNEE